MIQKTLVISTVLAASLNAGMFGDLANATLGGGSTQAVAVNDVGAVIKTFQQAEEGLDKSVDLINSALGDKKQLAEWEEKEKSINAMPQSSEKDAAMKKLNEDQLAYATKMSESKDLNEKAKKLSSEQKAKVGTSVGNLLLVTLKNKQALNESQNLIQSISTNPVSALKFATDLPKLKDIVTTVPNQLTSLATLTTGYMNMAQSVGISVAQPKSADEELKAVDF